MRNGGSVFIFGRQKILSGTKFARVEFILLRGSGKRFIAAPFSLCGEMAERSIAAVLKTVEPKGSGGSNPSLSAIFAMPLTDKKTKYFVERTPKKLK